MKLCRTSFSALVIVHRSVPTQYRAAIWLRTVASNPVRPFATEQTKTNHERHVATQQTNTDHGRHVAATSKDTPGATHHYTTNQDKP